AYINRSGTFRMRDEVNRRVFIRASVLSTGAGLVALQELFGDAVKGNKIHYFTHDDAWEKGASCQIEPESVSYREPQNFKLVYEAGVKGLPANHGLMIRCLGPIEESLCHVRSSHPGYIPHFQILENVGIPRVIWIESSDVALLPGEKLIIELMNYALPETTASCAFAVLEVDPEGQEPEIGSGLTFVEVPTTGGRCVALATVSLKVVLPTRAQTNQALRIRIAAFDEYDLATPAFTGQVSLSSDFPFFDLPGSVTFLPEDEGSKVIDVIPMAAGIARVKAASGPMSAESNPCICSVEPVEDFIYWGEYHKHSYHCDGHLFPAELFDYARRYASLDWGMLSPHDMWPSPVKGARNWRALHEASEAAHAPGEFITFHGYEWTHDKPFSDVDARGHKVIIFLNPEQHLPIIPFTFEAEDDDPVFMPPTTLLHRLLERAQGDVIVIPHHLPLFKWWVFPAVHPLELGGPLPSMERAEIDAIQPVAEVFSKVHGNNESWELQDWIKSPTTFFQMPILHTFWQDALKQGVRAGAVCAGDNHYKPMGHPGHTALTAVISPTLTREGIFRAIQSRRTYGTTGPRVFIHFTVNGAGMGEILSRGRGKELPCIDAVVVSPLPIDLIEVVRVSKCVAETAHTCIVAGEREYSFSWEDPVPQPEDWVCYYLRIHLDNDTEGAWTSPVWIEYSS
ncbi:MAG: DUF3604 domain-containing protein, partial [Planctomycetota bacterium]